MVEHCRALIIIPPMRLWELGDARLILRDARLRAYKHQLRITHDLISVRAPSMGVHQSLKSVDSKHKGASYYI